MSFEKKTEALEYYGSRETWYLLEETYSIITDRDLSKVRLPFSRNKLMGGKRAREVLEKYKRKESERE